MRTAQPQAIASGIDDPLRRWRNQVLNWMLALGSLMGLPAIGLVVFDLIRAPRDWLVLLLVGLYLVMVCLALVRRLDPRLRAWGLLLVVYGLGVTSFMRGGLVGVGRQYLLILPVLAIILIGPRSGVLMTLLSLLTMALFALLAHWGILAAWIVVKENPLSLYAWVSEEIYTAVLMVAVVTLSGLFYRFQARTLLAERLTAAELKNARQLLREHNQTLEERVTQRTTDLARAMRQVEHEKQYSEALIQYNPAAIVTTDSEANVVTWNPAAERLFGYAAAQAIGRNVDALLANNSALRDEALGYSQQVTGGGHIHAVTQRVRQDGTPVPVELWALPVVVAGEKGSFIALYHDLTEIKRAEEALQESHRRLADIINFMPDSVMVIDQVGRVIAWNRAMEEMTGTKAEEMLDKGNYEYALPFYGERRPILIDLVLLPQQEIERRYAQIRREDQVLIGETYVPHLKGSGAYLLGSASALHDSKGHIVGAIEVIRDFSERKRMEEEIQREKQYLGSLVANSPTAIIVLDSQARVLSWNPAAEKLFGYSAAEAASHYIGDLIAPTAEMKAHARANAQATAAGSMIRAITQRCRKDGSVVDVELLGVPMITETRQLGTLAIFHDITELEQARKAAEAATQAKSAFLATMSHEIRTPMNAIIGMTGLLLETPLTAEQREFAETIRISGDALLNIINDILDFSKIEAGRMDLERQTFDLRECVESAVDLLAGKATEKGLGLGCVVEQDVPAAIVGDMTRLRQILVNLLGNAVKFTERGEVVIHVGWAVEGQEKSAASSGRLLHFSVRDTGIGIPLDRQSRLFQSFSQVDASTTRRFGGTGLGLAISRRLTEMMGGTMWAESEGVPGQGSTFHFTIRAEAAHPLVQRPYLRSIQPRLEGRRVLIVDDNATNRHILSLQTQAWGMRPRDTALPREALAWIGRGDPFDVALLDLQMPEMDGVMLAGEIRRLCQTSPLPIVLLSSRGQREATAGGVELATYLLKPIKPSHLYNALVGIFGTGEAVEEEGQTDAHLDPDMAARHPLSILLAEDNAINQKLAFLVLQRLGYRADVAANGLEVLQAVRRQPYDMILMDVQMPEMDGLEATRAIQREFDAQRRPRIVAMTANAMREDREECLAAGMDDFIAKPIQFADLVAALNKCQARAVAQMGEHLAPGLELPEATQVPTLAAGEPAPAVLDTAALQRLRSTLGKQADAVLPSLLESFFKDVPRLITEARRSREQGQLADLRRAAHTLKSSSATFGALALSALARQLEYAARDGKLDDAPALLAQIESRYAQTRAALETWRGAPRKEP